MTVGENNVAAGIILEVDDRGHGRGGGPASMIIAHAGKTTTAISATVVCCKVVAVAVVVVIITRVRRSSATTHWLINRSSGGRAVVTHTQTMECCACACRCRRRDHLAANGDVRGSYATNSAGMANLTELSRPLLLLLLAAANLISFTD